jgi:hypothetical protein
MEQANEAYTGGCSCGAIRYEIPGEPIFSNHCHCRTCQGRSGTGHGSYATFMADGAKVEGEASQWEVAAESGIVKTHGFCPTCGSPVYLTIAAAPQFFIIHAGSLDDPERYVPQVTTYAGSALSWDQADPGLTRFEKMPPAQ